VGGALSLTFLALARPAARLDFAGLAGALRRWSIGLGFATLSACATLWSEQRYLHHRDVDIAAPSWPTLWFVIALAVVALVYLRGRLDAPRVVAGVSGAALILGTVHLWMFDGTWRQMIGFALVVVFCGAYTFAAAAMGSRRGVNAATLALAARVMLLALELFESLTRTGFGLIVTGLLLCAVAWAWWRMRVLVPMARPMRMGGTS
jgi:hypothetical protein